MEGFSEVKFVGKKRKEWKKREEMKERKRSE